MFSLQNAKLLADANSSVSAGADRATNGTILNFEVTNGDQPTVAPVYVLRFGGFPPDEIRTLRDANRKHHANL